MKIKKLMHSFNRCMNHCVVLNFGISNFDFQISTYTSISRMHIIEISKVYVHWDKETLKIQSFIQPRLWKWWFYLAKWLIVFFVGLDIYIIKMLRVFFYLKIKMSNWQNIAPLLFEVLHILIFSVPSCIRLKNRVLGK